MLFTLTTSGLIVGQLYESLQDCIDSKRIALDTFASSTQNARCNCQFVSVINFEIKTYKSDNIELLHRGKKYFDLKQKQPYHFWDVFVDNKLVAYAKLMYLENLDKYQLQIVPYVRYQSKDLTLALLLEYEKVVLSDERWRQSFIFIEKKADTEGNSMYFYEYDDVEIIEMKKNELVVGVTANRKKK